MDRGPVTPSSRDLRCSYSVDSEEVNSGSSGVAGQARTLTTTFWRLNFHRSASFEPLNHRLRGSVQLSRPSSLSESQEIIQAFGCKSCLVAAQCECLLLCGQVASILWPSFGDWNSNSYPLAVSTQRREYDSFLLIYLLLPSEVLCRRTSILTRNPSSAAWHT